MKKLSKITLLVVLFIGMTAPAWGQASTQGKEFWVSSTIVCSPGGSGNKAEPYIAISAEKACTVTITNAAGDVNITQQLAAGSWSEFGHNSEPTQTNPNAGPVKVPLDPAKWYPINMSDASNVRSLAGQINNYGLHIKATENISVYVILSSLNSMDASNILPINALGAEYYTQDYWPIVKSDFSNTVTMATILATEDNTKVDIIPNGNTADGHASGQLYTVSLRKGQTYYLMSAPLQQLTGTHIQAKDGRKIAVFNGVPLTNLPTGIAARDCLFEQSMPVEYWGTQFIVTRSLEKNGNLIGITATQRGTEIKVDGYTQAYINEGETYYIMLQSAFDPNGNKPGEKPIDLVITADAAYIETSCPCAVYSYDTGNSYKGKQGDEIMNSQGDPASVWVSPIQQKINKITFGTCYTKMTKEHFLNIVAETATCQNTQLTAIYGANRLDKTNLLVWIPVPGNPAYSYARAKIGDASTTNFSVFNLENAKGFIAQIYGNGEDESYAYSAGSAAVEQGVNVNGETFTNGYISDTKFCFGEPVDFDAQIGTDEISRVDWDFGDGITQKRGDAQTTHDYTVPGWYDVTAELYGHQVCTDESEQYLGSVQFTFRIVRPDTIFYYEHDCLDEDYIGEIKNDTVWPTNIVDCDTVKVTVKMYGKNSSLMDTIRAEDHYYEPINGITYPQDPDNPLEYEQTIELNLTQLFGTKNASDCDSIIYRHIKITTCLDMSIVNDPATQHFCPGETFDVPYTFRKGTIGDAYFIMGNEKTPVTPNGGFITIPVESLKPGTYQSLITVDDPNCEQTLQFPLDLTVYFPRDIFAYKFNNVLAVYKNGYGGNTGYDFIAYQWYKNGMPIEGATQSIYHTAAPFTLGDEYFVLLTDKSGLTLPSCSQTINDVPDLNQRNATPAKKVVSNQHMYIEREGQTYTIYGQRIR